MIRRSVNVFLAAALLLALVVSLSSCGGGDDDSATASEQPLTKAQFIKRASAICESEEARKKRALEAGSKLGEKFLAGSKKELTELVADVILPLYDEMIAELAALNPPAAEKAEVERLIDKYEKTLVRAEAEPKTLVTNDIFWKVNVEATKYGIKNCTI